MWEGEMWHKFHFQLPIGAQPAEDGLCQVYLPRAQRALSLLFYLFLQDFSAPEELDLLWRAVKMPELCAWWDTGLIRSDL